MKNIFKKFIVSFSLIFILFGFNYAFAFEGSIVLENNCSVIDTNSVTHNFPEEGSPSEYLAICALAQAKTEGIIESFELTEFSGMGLFVDSINGVKDPSTSYWALYYNGVYELEHGLTTLSLSIDDSISLVYVDFNGTELGPRVDIHIIESDPVSEEPIKEICTNEATNPPVCDNNVIAGSSSNSYKSFSLDKAILFLESQQKENGSFGESLYTDWVAIGVAKEGNNVNELKSKLSEYLKSEDFKASSITDYERHAMALMSLGINPYDDTNINYIEKITDSFDGEQIGSKGLWNDDIFGLIVLQKVGYEENDEIIKSIIDFILSKQESSGSWGSVDMTSAGIMALSNFKNTEVVDDAIKKAENYLIESQKEDGGFENSSSTSWAIQALSLNNSYNSEINNAIKYLTEKQQDDGGLDGGDINSRIWSTSYVVPAILKLSWNDILESFDKVKDNSDSNQQNNILPEEEKEMDPIVIVEKEEVVQEEAKVITPKIVKPVIKKKVEIKPEINAELNTNPLTASVANFDRIDDRSAFRSEISKVLKKIAHPFVWLWIHLGF